MWDSIVAAAKAELATVGVVLNIDDYAPIVEEEIHRLFWLYQSEEDAECWRNRLINASL